MFIRPAIPEDIPILKVLYYDTIVTVGSRDYNAAQISAWASTAENTDSFARRIREQYFYIAEEETPGNITFDETVDIRPLVIGFASFESRKNNASARANGGNIGKKGGTADMQTGYLDLLYVHKDFQRRGVATLLLSRILETARESGLWGIDVEASITARPFFEKHNFRMSGEQTVFVKGVALLNYKMHLDLTKHQTWNIR